MKIEANNPDDYASKVQDAHKAAIAKLRKTVKENLPKGFEEQMSYGMLGYVVPHSIYPDGYHCNTSLPLPFLNLASQKNFIGLYHMGIYADSSLYDWWVEEYGKRVPSKLDMGKSCVRLKKVDQIPYDLVAELCQKMTVEDWVNLYEKSLKR